MKHPGAGKPGESASQKISNRIAELGDWRGETLGRIRALIQETVPDVLEEWKWMGTPVWSRDGIICTGESYKSVVKMTFAKGASLKDPSRLFNSSLEGNVRRAIDIHEGEKLDVPALKTLIRAAVTLNGSGKKSAPVKSKKAATPRADKSAPAKSKKAAPAKAKKATTAKAKKGRAAQALKNRERRGSTPLSRRL